MGVESMTFQIPVQKKMDVEHPTGILKVMGLTPVGASEILFSEQFSIYFTLFKSPL